MNEKKVKNKISEKQRKKKKLSEALRKNLLRRKTSNKIP
jgi:hypothetical protein